MFIYRVSSFRPATLVYHIMSANDKGSLYIRRKKSVLSREAIKKTLSHSSKNLYFTVLYGGKSVKAIYLLILKKETTLWKLPPKSNCNVKKKPKTSVYESHDRQEEW